MSVRTIYRLASLLLCVGAFFAASPAHGKRYAKHWPPGRRRSFFRVGRGPNCRFSCTSRKRQEPIAASFSSCTASTAMVIAIATNGVIWPTNMTSSSSCQHLAERIFRPQTLIILAIFSIRTAAKTRRQNGLSRQSSLSSTILSAVSPGTRRGYALYGHSAGGQFVHRYVAFADAPRMESAVAANSGWYTMPDDGAFPYGWGGDIAGLVSA